MIFIEIYFFVFTALNEYLSILYIVVKQFNKNNLYDLDRNSSSNIKDLRVVECENPFRDINLDY